MSAALSGIDLIRLSGFDCVRVLQARYRQFNLDRINSAAIDLYTGTLASVLGLIDDGKTRRLSARGWG